MSVYLNVDEYGRVLQQMIGSDSIDYLEFNPELIAVKDPLADIFHYVDKEGKVHRLPDPPIKGMTWTGERWEDLRTQDQIISNLQVSLEDIRLKRDKLLSATDWVALKAMDTGVAVPTEWLAYRQALRDITDQEDPENIQWPIPPTA